MIVWYGIGDKMQKPLRDKRYLPSATSTGARWLSRASSSSTPPGLYFSSEHRQQQEHKTVLSGSLLSRGTYGK